MCKDSSGSSSKTTVLLGTLNSKAAHVVLEQRHGLLAVAVALGGNGGQRHVVKVFGQFLDRLCD